MSKNIFMKVKLSIALFVFLSPALFSQEVENMITDRPDQTESPAIVAPKHLQVENGFSLENENENIKNTVFHTSLWRYGINEFFELRLITELRQEKTFDNNIEGFTPVRIGFKSKLADEKGLWPQVSFIGQISVPSISSKHFKSTYNGPGFRFVMQNTLSDRVGLGYNFGTEWDGESPEPTFIYTISSSITLTDKLGCFFEFYGYLPQDNNADHRADTGLTYFITPNFMLDLSGGIGLSKNSPDNFISAGFSFRLPK